MVLVDVEERGKKGSMCWVCPHLLAWRHEWPRSASLNLARLEDVAVGSASAHNANGADA